MIEGEKKAIEHLNSFLNIPNYIWIKERERLIVNVKIALNLIENQEKYLKQEKEKNKKIETQRQNGTLSDGFHTFNDLYYQRCILFATICNLNKNIAWKSKKHNDGKKCFDSDQWFIVGIDTPEGTYTYHYEIKYWDLFTIQELEKGKEWDGHTEKDVTRLLSLINNNISKDKIKEKLKQNKAKTDCTYCNNTCTSYATCIFCKELLEEE